MGALDADPLPGRDPGLRRRRSAHLQRHGGDDRGRGSATRTRAIIVTHLFGNPCEMGAIMALAEHARHPGDRGLRAGVPRRGATAGSSARSARSAASACSRASTSPPARAGSWSPTTTRLARRMFLFINKAWGYGDPKPDHYFLALNYRMTELQGAVGAGAARQARAASSRGASRWRASLTERPAGLPGVAHAAVDAAATCTPTGSTACASTRRVIAGGPDALWRARSSDGGIASRPALHPEAGVRVRGLPRAAHVRRQPLAVHARPARSRSTTARSASPALRRAGRRARAAVERALHRRARRLHRAHACGEAARALQRVSAMTA